MLSKESKEYKMLSKEIARNIKCYLKRKEYKMLSKESKEYKMLYISCSL
jgi:hypothetical protein